MSLSGAAGSASVVGTEPRGLGRRSTVARIANGFTRDPDGKPLCVLTPINHQSSTVISDLNSHFSDKPRLDSTVPLSRVNPTSN